MVVIQSHYQQMDDVFRVSGELFHCREKRWMEDQWEESWAEAESISVYSSVSDRTRTGIWTF